MNVWCGEGNVGQEPKCGKTQSGLAYASLSLCTKERYQDKEGQWREREDWHNLKAWRFTAEFIQRNIHKGSRVAVVGALRSDSYTNKEGAKVKTYEIEVREITPLNRVEAPQPAGGPQTAEEARDYEQPTGGIEW